MLPASGLVVELILTLLASLTEIQLNLSPLLWLWYSLTVDAFLIRGDPLVTSLLLNTFPPSSGIMKRPLLVCMSSGRLRLQGKTLPVIPSHHSYVRHYSLFRLWR